MRSPFQVLVIPYRRTAAGPEFALLRRSDDGNWQFVAGGGEVGESPIEAAHRETREEIGIAGEMVRLDSTATVPKNCFRDAHLWEPDVYVIPEHCFAVDVGTSAITLSGEHTDLRWASYEQSYRLLRYDSNRNALWELNERLSDAGRADAQNTRT